MTEHDHSPRLYRFDSFEVDLRAGELHRAGRKARMPHQSFQILTMLLRKPGDVVTRDEIPDGFRPTEP